MSSWTLIGACAVVLVLPIAWRVYRRQFDPFEPIVLFALAWGAMFVVRPTAMLIRGERFFWGLDVRPWLPQALLLAELGAVAFVVAYHLFPGRRVAARMPAPRPVDESIAFAASLGACAVAVVALVLFLPVSDGVEALRVLLDGRSDAYAEAISETSTYVLNMSLLFVPAALVLAALALRRRSPLFVAVATGVLALALVRVLPSGGRVVLLPLLGGIFVLAYLMRGRRPGVLVLSAVAIAALLGSFVLLHTREANDDLTLVSAVKELEDRPHAVFDPLIRTEDAEMVLALSASLSVVPDDLGRRWGGATVGNLVTRPVPRELWPGKPLPPGQQVVKTIWPQHYPALDPAFTPLLGLYWDFGLAGVALGMAFFGVLARLLYSWFLLHRDELAAQLVFAASVWFVVIGVRNDPVDTIVLAAFLVAPVVVIVALASSRVVAASPWAERAGRSPAEPTSAQGPSR